MCVVFRKGSVAFRVIEAFFRAKTDHIGPAIGYLSLSLYIYKFLYRCRDRADRAGLDKALRWAKIWIF